MLKKMGRFDQAEGVYKKAMALDSSNVVLLCNYANFLKKVRGDLEAAKELYEKGLELNPNAEYLLKNYAIFKRDYERSGGVGVGVGGGLFSSFKGNRSNPASRGRDAKPPAATAAAATAAAAATTTGTAAGAKTPPSEKKRRVAAEAKKRVASGDDRESSRDEERGTDDSDGEEGEGEDFFEADTKLPAHLLTNKRDPSQMPLEIGGEGWVMYRHPKHGLYYHNEITNDSTYNKPEGFASNEHSFARMRTAAGGAESKKEEGKGNESDYDDEEGGKNANNGDVPTPSKGEKPAEVLDNAWARFVDPNSNLTYFYNMATGDSQYERPDEFITAGNPFEDARGGSSGEGGGGSGGGGGGDDKPDADILNSRRGLGVKPNEVLQGGVWVRFTDEETKYTCESCREYNWSQSFMTNH